MVLAAKFYLTGKCLCCWRLWYELGKFCVEPGFGNINLPVEVLGGRDRVLHQATPAQEVAELVGLSYRKSSDRRVEAGKSKEVGEREVVQGDERPCLEVVIDLRVNRK